MNRYENHETLGRRAALGIVALAMTAISIGLALVVPAKMTSGSQEIRWSAASKAVAPAAADSVSRMRIDVIGVRDPSLASAQVRNVQAKRRQQG